MLCWLSVWKLDTSASKVVLLEGRRLPFHDGIPGKETSLLFCVLIMKPAHRRLWELMCEFFQHLLASFRSVF